MKNQKTKKIIELALPATIENLLQTLVGFVDTLMVAKIGLAAVTAVGVANSILNVYLAVFIALSVGTSSLIAQKLGSLKKEDARIIARQSTVIACGMGLLFAVGTLLFGKQMLQMMGATNNVLDYSLQFFYVVGGASIFIALMTVFGSILRATGDTKTPMKVSIIINVLNIILNYVFIFGFAPIPALGVVGTAIGTTLSRFIGTILLYKKIQLSEVHFSIRSLANKSNYRPLIELSIPATLERMVMRIGQVVYFGLIVGIGSVTFAAHSIAGNIESFTYMPAYGLATAATTLVGMSIGSKNFEDVKEYAYQSTKIGVAVLSICGVGLFLGAPFYAQLFTTSPEAIDQVVIALRIDAFIQPALATSLILTGALQGMGDTKTPLYSTAFGMWVIRIIGVIVLGKWLSMGIAGIWISIGIDLYLRSIFLAYKFRMNLNKMTL